MILLVKKLIKSLLLRSAEKEGSAEPGNLDCSSLLLLEMSNKLFWLYKGPSYMSINCLSRVDLGQGEG